MLSHKYQTTFHPNKHLLTHFLDKVELEVNSGERGVDISIKLGTDFHSMAILASTDAKYFKGNWNGALLLIKFE